MTGLITLVIIPAILSIVGILMAVHIMTTAHMDLWPLWIGLTTASAMGCAFVFNYKPVKN